jgi:hypothetical protein
LLTLLITGVGYLLTVWIMQRARPGFDHGATTVTSR